MDYLAGFQFYLAVDSDASISFRPPYHPCCTNCCGNVVPFVANGNYNNPNDGGKTRIDFNLANSATCGIPFARVLRGDLEGLFHRDDLARLNPSADSMRLRIEVSDISFVISS